MIPPTSSQLAKTTVKNISQTAPWGRLPVEWDSGRIFATLKCLLIAPQQSFRRIHEPIQHASILRFLAALRLPLWLALIILLASRGFFIDIPEFAIRPIHKQFDPHLVEVLSLWILLLVPLSIPFLYFFLGLLTHVSLALTGGAGQSISATMRATGFALAPVYIGLAVLDIPLYLHVCSGFVFLLCVLVFILIYFVQLTNAMMGTQSLSLLRGMAVSLLPTLIFGAFVFARGFLEVPDFPGWEPPPFLPYIVP